PALAGDAERGGDMREATVLDPPRSEPGPISSLLASTAGPAASPAQSMSPSTAPSFGPSAAATASSAPRPLTSSAPRPLTRAVERRVEPAAELRVERAAAVRAERGFDGGGRDACSAPRGGPYVRRGVGWGRAFAAPALGADGRGVRRGHARDRRGRVRVPRA